MAIPQYQDDPRLRKPKPLPGEEPFTFKYVSPWGSWTNLPGTMNGPTSLTGKYFPGLTDIQKSFYQSKEGNPYAYQAVIGQMARPGSYAHDWLGDQYSQTLANFVNASTKDPNLQLTDYLQQQAPTLAEKYTGLRGWERGEGASSFGSGRSVYR